MTRRDHLGRSWIPVSDRRWTGLLQVAAHDRISVVGGSHMEAAPKPELRRRGARLIDGSRQVRIRLDGGEPPLGEFVTHVTHELPSVAGGPNTTGRGDAGDDPGRRHGGELRVQLPDALCSRIGRQRPELRVGDGLIPQECDPGIGAEDPRPRSRSASFRGTPSVRGRSRPGPGANGFQPGVANRSSPANTSAADDMTPSGRGSEPRSAAARSSAGSCRASRGRANGLSNADGGVRVPGAAGGGASSQPGRDILLPRSAFSQ